MTLEDAMGLSRAYERLIVTSDPPPTGGRATARLALRSSLSALVAVTLMPTTTAAPTTTSGAPQRPRRPPGTRFTRLTAEEMAQR
jgi:hypothetical protein